MELCRLLCRLCSHSKRTAPGLGSLPFVLCCIRVRLLCSDIPNEPIFRGKRSLFRNNCSKRDRCESTLSYIFLKICYLSFDLVARKKRQMEKKAKKNLYGDVKGQSVSHLGNSVEFLSHLRSVVLDFTVYFLIVVGQVSYSVFINRFSKAF